MKFPCAGAQLKNLAVEVLKSRHQCVHLITKLKDLNSDAKKVRQECHSVGVVELLSGFHQTIVGIDSTTHEKLTEQVPGLLDACLDSLKLAVQHTCKILIEMWAAGLRRLGEYVSAAEVAACLERESDVLLQLSQAASKLQPLSAWYCPACSAALGLCLLWVRKCIQRQDIVQVCASQEDADTLPHDSLIDLVRMGDWTNMQEFRAKVGTVVLDDAIAWHKATLHERAAKAMRANCKNVEEDVEGFYKMCLQLMSDAPHPDPQVALQALSEMKFEAPTNKLVEVSVGIIEPKRMQFLLRTFGACRALALLLLTAQKVIKEAAGDIVVRVELPPLIIALTKHRDALQTWAVAHKDEYHALAEGWYGDPSFANVVVQTIGFELSSLMNKFGRATAKLCDAIVEASPPRTLIENPSILTALKT